MKLAKRCMLVAAAVSFVFFACDRQDEVAPATVNGSYELKAVANTKTNLFFSGSRSSGRQAYLSVDSSGIRIVSVANGVTNVLKEVKGPVTFPCAIRILKKGNFFRFWAGNLTNWIRGPLGEWAKVYESFQNEVYAEETSAIEKKSWAITKLPWLQQATEPVLRYGPPGSYYEWQAIPGAILEYNGRYYMYFMAGMAGNEEGSSRRSIGMAVSDNLVDWKVSPEPVVRQTDYVPYDNLYINGAVVTPDNKIALFFSVQQFPEWKGFLMATSSSPEGPFVAYEKNPVYKHFTHAHEFDLADMKQEPVEYEGTKYRYLFFYAGFTPRPSSGKAGDKGYLLYSNDLVNWTSHKNNPVFGPETLDNWDAGHVRPRSLTQYGGYWYLWYEGTNNWLPPEGAAHQGEWWDAVGLARSKDLTNWEYYPRNPALPGLGLNDAQVGSAWIGWPRMVVKNDTGYVFFCGSHDKGMVSVACRTIPMNALTNWETESAKK